MVVPDQGLKTYRWYAKDPYFGRRNSYPMRFIKAFDNRYDAIAYASEIRAQGYLNPRIRRYTIYDGVKKYWGVYLPENQAGRRFFV